MSLQQTEAHQESYFVAQLAAEAKRPDVAAPATIDSLVAKLTYLKDEEIDLVKAAHDYARKAHEGQTRRTGHEYITHPMAVAQILADMNMDHQSLMAALLHDVIEDSDDEDERRRFDYEANPVTSWMWSLFFAIKITSCFLISGLLIAVMTMARGGDYNVKNSNRIMRYRIIFQAVALIVILGLIWWRRSTG